VFLRAFVIVTGAFGYGMLFSFGFYWAGLIAALLSGSLWAGLIAGIAGGGLLCWFAHGLMRDIAGYFVTDDRDRVTWM